MKVYQEITLLPNPDEDVPLYYLWSKLYQQLHLAWVEVKNSDGKVSIGTSFPKYDLNQKHLGCKLRLFAQSEAELESLNLTKWLSRLNDYVHVKKIQNVPVEVDGYAFFSRLTEKGNDAKSARRRAQNLGVSYEDALAFFQNKQERQQPKHNPHLYPFIKTRSLSTDNGENRYHVTIVCTKTDALVLGKGFSTYGLSSDSSVPIFK